MASESSPLLDLARQVWRELQPLRDAQTAGSDPVAARLLQLQPLAAADADPAAAQRLRGWLDDYYTAASVAASAIRAGKPPGAELELAGAKLGALAGTLPAPVGPVVEEDLRDPRHGERVDEARQDERDRGGAERRHDVIDQPVFRRRPTVGHGRSGHDRSGVSSHGFLRYTAPMAASPMSMSLMPMNGAMTPPAP